MFDYLTIYINDLLSITSRSEVDDCESRVPVINHKTEDNNQHVTQVVTPVDDSKR